MSILREVLTVRQVAELLQVSPDMVYRLAANGELPGRKIGRIWRFTRTAIDDYLSQDVGAESSRDSSGDGPTSRKLAPVDEQTPRSGPGRHPDVG